MVTEMEMVRGLDSVMDLAWEMETVTARGLVREMVTGLDWALLRLRVG